MPSTHGALVMIVIGIFCMQVLSGAWLDQACYPLHGCRFIMRVISKQDRAHASRMGCCDDVPYACVLNAAFLYTPAVPEPQACRVRPPGGNLKLFCFHILMPIPGSCHCQHSLVDISMQWSTCCCLLDLNALHPEPNLAEADHLQE